MVAFVAVLPASESLGDPGAGVWKRHVVDASSRGADGVRLADVNGDGRLDIATGWEEGGIVRAYLNPGFAKSRAPWPRVTVGKVASPEDAVFVDLDADGAVDVVSSSEGRLRTMHVHWAPRAKERYLDESAWKTDVIPVTRGVQSWMFCVPLDVDGRNGIDLVVGSKGRGAAVGWLESPPRPRELGEWKYHKLRDAGWIMSIRPFDLDGDGDQDLVVSDRRGGRRGVFWLANPGRGGGATESPQSWPERTIDSKIGEAMFLDVRDADGDGLTDIACAVKGRGFVHLERRALEDNAWRSFTLPRVDNVGTAKAAAMGDIDRDGRFDIVFSCENAAGARSGVRWLSSRRVGDSVAWVDHEISGPRGVKFDRLELLDLDGDGDLDVLTCEERDNLGVVWYENPHPAATDSTKATRK